MILDKVPEAEQLRPALQSAGHKLMAAAETGARDDIEAATKQAELAVPERAASAAVIAASK
jgi:hypothetical protein